MLAERVDEGRLLLADVVEGRRRVIQAGDCAEQPDECRPGRLRGKVALLDMTLTSPACPLTDVIEDQSRSALIGAGLVDELRINWVWNPPWGPDKITEDGRDQLRALGFTV